MLMICVFVYLAGSVLFGVTTEDNIISVLHARQPVLGAQHRGLGTT